MENDKFVLTASFRVTSVQLRLMYGLSVTRSLLLWSTKLPLRNIKYVQIVLLGVFSPQEAAAAQDRPSTWPSYLTVHWMYNDSKMMTTTTIIILTTTIIILLVVVFVLLFLIIILLLLLLIIIIPGSMLRVQCVELSRCYLGNTC